MKVTPGADYMVKRNLTSSQMHLFFGTVVVENFTVWSFL